MLSTKTAYCITFIPLQLSGNSKTACSSCISKTSPGQKCLRFRLVGRSVCYKFVPYSGSVILAVIVMFQAYTSKIQTAVSLRSYFMSSRLIRRMQKSNHCVSIVTNVNTIVCIIGLFTCRTHDWVVCMYLQPTMAYLANINCKTLRFECLHRISFSMQTNVFLVKLYRPN